MYFLWKSNHWESPFNFKVIMAQNVPGDPIKHTSNTEPVEFLSTTLTYRALTGNAFYLSDD